MKVKIIYSYEIESLENEINDFIKDKKVYDIKYTTNNVIESEDYFTTAYILYDDMEMISKW